MGRRARMLGLCFSLVSAACGSDDADETTPGADAGSDAGELGALAFTGEFTMGSTIPPKHKCPMSVLTGGMGDNISPALSWEGAPAGTKSFAVVLFDTRYSFFHWAVWDIPKDVRALPEGIPPGFELASPAGARQMAATGRAPHAYFGPCSDAGPLAGTYEYRLFALSVESLQLTADASYEQLQAALEGATLEITAWEGTPE